jgi:predicted dehydrogenase
MLSAMKNRRTFLKTTAASAVGLMFVKLESAFGSQANSAVQLGIIGCGGRGQWIGNFFSQQPDAKIVAIHDVFDDRLQAMQKRFDVPANRVYKGLEAYQEMLASAGVDAVAIESPPYYHPEQAAAAVAAGKHVYCAKPIAVDVAGAKSFMKTAGAAGGKVSVLVDFQTRVQPVFQECARRVHDGDIGRPVLGHVYYHAGRLRPQTVPSLTADQNRLRNWVFDKVLSGDIIVEQNIHVIDVANWYLNGHPIAAAGTGGRLARTDVGDCWDHFVVNFRYANEVKVDFSSAQFTRGYDDLCIRLYGSGGTADSHYGGLVRITGDKPWNGAEKDDTFNAGALTNVKNFIESIKTGKLLNNGVECCYSNLTAILGRNAAYKGSVVTWEDMLASDEKLAANLRL